MNTLQISGHSFPERPPNRLQGHTPLQRYTYLVDALAFAGDGCAEVDRSLYKSIREAQAHAMNLRARALKDSPAEVVAALTMSSASELFD